MTHAELTALFGGWEEYVIPEIERQDGDDDSSPQLWITLVGRGRGHEDIRPVFELLGEAGCRQIKVCAMDMSTAFRNEFQAQCPQADIVFDQFHVVAKYGREVIDRVRVDEAKRLATSQRDRKVIKGSRWLLLRNRENVPK